MKKIKSRHNQAIKHICSLHTAKGRRTYNQFIAEGIRTCTTIVQAGTKLVQLYATQEQYETACKIAQSNYITIVDSSVMHKITPTKQPSGILALFEQPATPSPAALSTGIILLQLRDPGNVGTLIRSCAAMGQSSVVCIDSVDPWSPKVVQASAGSIAQVTIFQWDWSMLLAHKRQLILAALVVKKGEPLKSIKGQNILLVVGNEAHGIPSSHIQSCNTHVTLAMPGKTESLNAAVAGSIALYVLYANA